MTKRGKIPSLISGSAGHVRFVTAKGKRTCKRCGEIISKGVGCVEVSKPGMIGGHKTYCKNCFNEILIQTKSDVSKLEEKLQQL